jgi:nicotinamide-nucleotide amidase
MSHVTADPVRPAGAAHLRAGARVEIVTIGDELLLGFTIDTNAAHLARALADLGIAISRRTTVGDSAREIASGVRDAIERTGAVITTGGLGPTSDDLTKQSVAELFGRDLVVDEVHVQWMKQRWRDRFGREMPESNIQQAMLPRGARKLENHHGSALGAWIEDEQGRWVAMLPGVPRELRGMTADTLLPILRERYHGGAVVRSRTLRTTGIAESLLADRIGDADAITEGEGTLAYLPGENGVDLRVTVQLPDADTADALLARAVARLRERAGDHAYGEGDADLAAVVLEKCRGTHATIAVAESCTGGLLGARLTAIPGSSEVVLGGVIAYGNEIKRDSLGVRQEDLDAHGAVSEPVVRQMASGVRERTKATIGVAITGIAGPSGGTPEKPVGTVWIATDIDGRVEARLLRLIGDRNEVRFRATQSVLEMVRRAL